MKQLSLYLFLFLALLVPSQAGVITTYDINGDWTSALTDTPLTVDLGNPTSSTSTDIVVGNFTFTSTGIQVNAGVLSSSNTILITLDPSLKLWALAFNWATTSGPVSQTATITVNTANSGSFDVSSITSGNIAFFGLTSTDQITSLSFSVPQNPGVTIDTVEYSDTPEAASFWLLGAPLALLLTRKFKAS